MHNITKLVIPRCLVIVIATLMFSSPLLSDDNTNSTDNLVPLAIGNQWVYSISQDTPSEESGSKIIWKVVSTKEYQQETWFEIQVTTFWSEEDFDEDKQYMINRKGIGTFARTRPNWDVEPELIAKDPVQLGDQWESEGLSYRVMSSDTTITVPAGTFKSCVLIEVIEGTALYRIVYKPNVGMIKLTAIMEDQDGEAAISLKSMTLH